MKQITLILPETFTEEKLAKDMEGKMIQLISMCPTHNVGVIIFSGNPYIDAECSLQGLNCLAGEIMKRVLLEQKSPESVSKPALN